MCLYGVWTLSLGWSDLTGRESGFCVVLLGCESVSFRLDFFQKSMVLKGDLMRNGSARVVLVSLAPYNAGVCYF